MSNYNPYASPSFSTESPISPFQQGNGEIRNVKTDINDVLDYSLKVWKENLWLLIGAALIVIGLAIGLAVFQNYVDSMLKGADQRPTIASISFSMGFSIVSNIVQSFLGIGYLQMLLALLRQQPASIEMLFGGIGRLLPTIGVTVLLALAIGIGFLLLIIPGVIVILFYWPAYYLVIDRKTPVLQSFKVARSITKGNELTTFVVGLLSVAIALIGLLALCIGVLAAQPLALLLFACAYLMMSGQINSKGQLQTVN